MKDYFPDFLWIVRDFSLQLQNENNEKILPREYLEMTLNSVSNSNNKSSDEAKNKIRKVIKDSFKQRDCFLMVRPITDESKLQSLNSLPETELRSEFLEQVMILRKKILKNIKIKEFSGTSLLGDSLVSMVESYITAINAGVVPQINDLFTNICASEALKAVEECESIYESLMREVIVNNNAICQKQIKIKKDKLDTNSTNNNSHLHSNLKNLVGKLVSSMGVKVNNNTNNNSLLSNLVISHEILNSDSFSSYHQAFKQQALLHFREKLVFTVIENSQLSALDLHYPVERTRFSSKYVQESFEKLLQTIKTKKNYFKELLQEDIKGFIVKILHYAYSSIEYQLQLPNQSQIQSQNELTSTEMTTSHNSNNKLLDKNFELLFVELEKVGNHLLALFPDYPFTKEYYNDFRANILSLVLSIVKQKTDSDNELTQKQLSLQLEKFNTEKAELENKFKQFISKSDLASEQLKATINNLKAEIEEKKTTIHLNEQENSIKIKSLNDQILRIKDEKDKKISELNLRVEQEKEKASDAERVKIKTISEAEKEKALLNQVIEHQTRQIEEFKKSDKESNKELMSHYKEQQIALKENTSKYDKLVSELNAKINSLNEKILDYENSLSNISSEKKDEEKKNTELLSELERLKQTNLSKINELTSLFEQEKAKNSKISKELNEENDKNTASLKKLLQDQYDTLNNTIKNLKDVNVNITNENNALNQKVELLTHHNQEIEEKLASMKENSDSLMKKLEISAGKSLSNEELKKRIDEVKEYYEKDKQILIDSYEKTVTSLNNKIESLNDLINKETKLSELEKNELIKEKFELKNKLESVNFELKEAHKKKKTIEAHNETLVEEHELEINRITQEYEKQIELIKNSNSKEISEITTTSEEQIKKLRNMFDLEKAKIEEKMRTEKAAAERKLKTTISELESQYNDMELELKNEIELLNNDLSQLKAEFDDYVNRAEKEIDLLKQSKETLEGLWEGSKQALVKNQQQFKQSYEAIVETSTKERNDLMKKLETLNADYLVTDKELTTTSIRKESLEKEVKDLERQLSAKTKELEDERKETHAMMEKLTNK